MKQRRFLPWTNNLEAEPVKVKDTNIKATRTEFKVANKIEKTIDCKILVSKQTVTKDYVERKKKPTDKNFGCGTGESDVRLNLGVSQIQRDNIWHPYYEIKLDDDDLGTKFRKNAEKKAEKDIDGGAIKQI